MRQALPAHTFPASLPQAVQSPASTLRLRAGITDVPDRVDHSLYIYYFISSSVPSVPSVFLVSKLCAVSLNRDTLPGLKVWDVFVLSYALAQQKPLEASVGRTLV